MTVVFGQKLLFKKDKRGAIKELKKSWNTVDIDYLKDHIYIDRYT